MDHVITEAGTMNSVFALVLGLVALIYLAATMAVFGLEINVVVANRLYPRALLTPFTDAVQLTDADRRVYTEYAQTQRHKDSSESALISTTTSVECPDAVSAA